MAPLARKVAVMISLQFCLQKREQSINAVGISVIEEVNFREPIKNSPHERLNFFREESRHTWSLD
jgi:hypothetical protein